MNKSMENKSALRFAPQLIKSLQLSDALEQAFVTCVLLANSVPEKVFQKTL